MRCYSPCALAKHLTQSDNRYKAHAFRLGLPYHFWYANAFVPSGVEWLCFSLSSCMHVRSFLLCDLCFVCWALRCLVVMCVHLSVACLHSLCVWDSYQALVVLTLSTVHLHVVPYYSYYCTACVSVVIIKTDRVFARCFVTMLRCIIQCACTGSICVSSLSRVSSFFLFLSLITCSLSLVTHEHLFITPSLFFSPPLLSSSSLRPLLSVLSAPGQRRAVSEQHTADYRCVSLLHIRHSAGPAGGEIISMYNNS